MLTITCDQAVSAASNPAQFETLPSDAEIYRRVRQIRSRWSDRERVERRRAAEARFAALLEKLSCAEAA